MSNQDAPKSIIYINKRSIRLYLYICSLSSIILLALILSFLYIKSLRSEFDDITNKLSTSIIEEKKRFLRNTIDITLHIIEHERKQVLQEHAKKNIPDKQLKAIAIGRIRDIIHKLRLLDDGYIWVNEIVNYQGGDNYAIRTIHPNLPETEGMLLSTHTTDILGNRPYEAELNGIKEHGELYFDYYFKKMNSEIVAHKLSYAKLYKPFDWVVATGVYLDDVDRLIQREKIDMQQTSDAQQMLTLSIAMVAVLLTAISIVFFEKQFIGLVSNYEQRIGDYTATLEKLSITDKLTGLFNRLKLDDVFDYELAQAQRYKKSFSILLLDIDGFKTVNDTYGHQVGDQVLVEFSGVLASNSRSAESIGRWGGEEFLIILPETPHDGAMAYAEKIRNLVATHDFPVVGTITCSVGVSTYSTNDSKESMLGRADEALYRAKKMGRNTVRCAEPPHTT